MSKPTNLKPYIEGQKYIRETFMKAEDHAVVLFKCATWAVQSLDVLRRSAAGEKGLEIPEFPDKHMRNFEELGRRMDEFCADVNRKIPDFGDGK